MKEPVERYTISGEITENTRVPLYLLGIIGAALVTGAIAWGNVNSKTQENEARIGRLSTALVSDRVEEASYRKDQVQALKEENDKLSNILVEIGRIQGVLKIGPVAK